MIEGWYGSDYLILFNDAEIASASDRYAVSQFLPGYKVIGLRAWDNFILQDSGGATYCAPTVPAVAEQVSAYALPSTGATLSPDHRFQGKIKWYVKPIAFGGDPQGHENIIWVGHDQHAHLVNYWNSLYCSLKKSVMSVIRIWTKPLARRTLARVRRAAFWHGSRFLLRGRQWMIIFGWC